MLLMEKDRRLPLMMCWRSVKNWDFVQDRLITESDGLSMGKAKRWLVSSDMWMSYLPETDGLIRHLVQRSMTAFSGAEDVWMIKDRSSWLSMR